jgi:hypothetical protein
MSYYHDNMSQKYDNFLDSLHGLPLICFHPFNIAPGACESSRPGIEGAPTHCLRASDSGALINVNGKLTSKADFIKKEGCHPLFFKHIGCRNPKFRNACSSLDAEIERCTDPEENTYIVTVSDEDAFPANHIALSLAPVIRKRALPPIRLFLREGD